MGYYDDDIDWEKEAVRRYEEGQREAERRRLLSTGSMSDASEAFGHDAWALNAYLARKEEGGQWIQKQQSVKKDKSKKDKSINKTKQASGVPDADPSLFSSEKEQEKNVITEKDRIEDSPAPTLDDAPPVYVLDEFDMVHIPAQVQTNSLFEVMYTEKYPISDDDLPF